MFSWSFDRHTQGESASWTDQDVLKKDLCWTQWHCLGQAERKCDIDTREDRPGGWDFDFSSLYLSSGLPWPSRQNPGHGNGCRSARVFKYQLVWDAIASSAFTYVTMSEILARFMVQGNMTRRAVVLWSWQDCVAETERPKPNLFSFKYHTRSIFPDWACPP